MGEEENKSTPSIECKRLISEGLLEIWDDNRSISSWSDLQNVVERLERCSEDKRPSWSFRGEGKWDQDIQSSLERAAHQFGIELRELYHDRIEQGIIRRFKRGYLGMYGLTLADDDHIGWLSIMQHHGAPTRLVDITYSLYIGLYFALWKYEAGQKVALWCFNNEWLCAVWNESPPPEYKREFDRDKDGRYIRLFEIVLDYKEPIIYLIDPYYLPERLVLQQGGFLLPIDVTKSFMENLAHMARQSRDRNRKRDFDLRIIKLQLSFSPKELKEVRYQLLRMNINNATLFPGLDGFSRSMFDRMPFTEQRAGLKKGFVDDSAVGGS